MKSGKKFSRVFLPVLLALVALFVAACEGGGGISHVTPTAAPARAAPAQQLLNLPLSVSDIPTFDPGQASDQASIDVISTVFSGLVQLNDQLQVTPQMASNWTSSSDGLTWTFTLKTGLMFSDGTPITSADVVYSIDRALSPQISNLSGEALIYLGLIKDSDKRSSGKIPSLINDSLLTPDANTVVIKLNKATAYFLQALAYPTSYVVEKKVISRWGLQWTDHLADNGGQGGAGPFRVSSYDHTKGIELVPDPFYYGPKPQLKKLRFLFYKSPTAQYEAYQAGQLDETAIPPANYAKASIRQDFKKNLEPIISYYTMNYLTKPFDNIHIRQAFELALNKDVIAQTIYQGRMIPTCHIVPSGIPGYNPNIQCPAGAPTSGDVLKARALFNQGLQEEGLTLATLPPLKITYPKGSPFQESEISAVRQMWQKILGINVQPDPIDFKLLLIDIENTNNNPSGLQMWAINWVPDYPDPRDWTLVQFDKGSPYNSSNYGQNNSSNAAQEQQVQNQLEQADVNTDVNARLLMYNQAEQQLVNDVAWLPMFQSYAARLLKPYVIGRVYNDLGQVPPDDWANVYIALH
jgi:peptide/nickel transport system substrate-binding protein/oligopeptide transport system substrate-binding protein